MQGLSFRTLRALVFLALLGIPSADAQLRTGDLFGVAAMQDGAPLPGVTIELTGPGTALVRYTDGEGRFRFPALTPGAYAVTASLDGFPTVVRDNVDIRLGHGTEIEIEMMPTVEKVITVDAESPLLDQRRITTGANVSKVELDQIPTARDPWVVIQTVPGVLTSDVNVGGNKSDDQQGIVGGGGLGWDPTYALDGVVSTDMAYPGSPGYFDFDSFEEIQVSTGGSEISRAGTGITVNLVTKSGTNQWRGSGRYIVADDGWQSGLALSLDTLGDGQHAFSQGDRINRVSDYGLEGGGPLLEDRLWLWADFARNEFRKRTIYDYRDDTDLETIGAKLNAQIDPEQSMVAFFYDNNKFVDGRGAGPTRPTPATWIQDGTTRIYKLEYSRLAGSNLFLNALISHTDSGFGLSPKGGIDGPNAVYDENFVWQNNFVAYDTDRPQTQIGLEGDLFVPTGSVDHEIKVGIGARDQETDELWKWPADVYLLDFYQSSFGYPFNVAAVARPEVYAYSSEYMSLFAQDNVRIGNLTANLGLRYDHQKGRLDGGTVPGVTGFETLPDGTPLLPPVTFEGRDQDFTWEDLQPRIGITWAVGPDRETLLRASYSRFAEQLFQFWAQSEYPLGASEAYFFYEDSDGDGRVTVDEIIGFDDGPLFTNGYDPLGGAGFYDFDPGFEATLSDEIVLSVERSLLPELVIGLHATLRNTHRWYRDDRLVIEGGEIRPHRREDYVKEDVVTGTRPDGSSFTVPVYGLRDGVTDTGRFRTVNGDRESDYTGLSLTLDKRLSRRWMARAHATWMDWTWDIPSSDRIDPNLSWDGWNDDGGPVHQHPLTPGWSYRVGGLVQIAHERPWGFNFSGNLWGRQGYGIPYYVTVETDYGTIDLQATGDVDDYRLPDVHLVDLRIDKDFAFGPWNTTLGIECFNVFNESTVLERNAQLGTATTNHVYEVVSPRIFRLFTRISLN